MALRIIFSQALRSAGESAFRNTTAFASSEMTDLPRDCASKFPSSAQDLAQPSAGRSFPEASFPTSGKNQGYIAEMPRAKVASSGAQEQQYADDNSTRASGVAANNFNLSPAVNASRRLSFHDKFVIYAHQTFGPPALILPAFSSGIEMANPPSHYPRGWRDGGGAYGRLYGNAIARATSLETARFLAGAAFHEDLRYKRSSSTNPLRRTAHAIAFHW
jgi:hypothetical protein